jgi:hypothetical protein
MWFSACVGSVIIVGKRSRIVLLLRVVVVVGVVAVAVVGVGMGWEKRAGMEVEVDMMKGLCSSAVAGVGRIGLWIWKLKVILFLPQAPRLTRFRLWPIIPLLGLSWISFVLIVRRVLLLLVLMVKEAVDRGREGDKDRERQDVLPLPPLVEPDRIEVAIEGGEATPSGGRRYAV